MTDPTALTPASGEFYAGFMAAVALAWLAFREIGPVFRRVFRAKEPREEGGARRVLTTIPESALSTDPGSHTPIWHRIDEERDKREGLERRFNDFRVEVGRDYLRAAQLEALRSSFMSEIEKIAVKVDSVESDLTSVKLELLGLSAKFDALFGQALARRGFGTPEPPAR